MGAHGYSSNINNGISAPGGVFIYPRHPWAMRQVRCRLLRWDVGGAIRISRAGGRRLEGERDGSRSRGSLRRQPPGCQQWRPAVKRGSRRPSLPAQTPHAAVFPVQGGLGSQRWPKIAERGCRKATPRGREAPWEPRTGLPRRSHRASWGGSSAPRLPSRHPRTRRTPRPSARDGRRVRRTSVAADAACGRC